MLDRFLSLKSLLRKQALVARLTKRFYGRHTFAVIVRTRQGLLAVDPEDFGVGRELVTTGAYGEAEIARLARHVRPDSRVLFVGAHVGSLVVPLSSRCRQVIAIEANPRSYELLEINLALNKATNCQAMSIAASDQAGPIDFLLSRANSGGSKRVPANKEFIYYYDDPQTITVQGARLDDRLADKAFDLIVMDIEGSEYFALRGMQEILRASKVLAVEFLPHHLKDVSRVSVADFVALIEPHFSQMTIPSQRRVVPRDGSGFAAPLQQMYDANQGDPGLIFEKPA